MSTLAIASQPSTALPSATFPARKHHAQGAAATGSIPSLGKAGDLPVGTDSGLIAGAAQSLQQSTGATGTGLAAKIGAILNVLV